jgi:hypothetical protein
MDRLALVLLLAVAQAFPAESIFPDKNLEAAVRKRVFAKRDNQQPLTRATDSMGVLAR